MSLLQTIDQCIEFINQSTDAKSDGNDEPKPKNEATSIEIYTIDGKNFSDSEGFYHEFEKALKWPWKIGRCHYAVFDVLRDCPPCVIIWKNSAISKKRLDHQCRAKDLKQFLKDGCHPDHFEKVNRMIVAVQNGEGDTLFEEFVKVLTFDPGSACAHVSLRLE